jgi:chromosome segregation ATPase
LKLRTASVDAMLQDEQASAEITNEVSDLGLELEDRAVNLSREKVALEKREREHDKLLAETLERVRVVRETEILLASRERLLDKREAILSTKRSNQSADEQIAVLEQSLQETRDTLETTNQILDEKEEVISTLREEIEQLNAALLEAPANAPAPESTPAPEQAEPASPYDKITHESLEEQVAFLKEREAFVEQSENVLFEKAQNLQEWETRLQQIQHDQVKAELKASLGEDKGPDGLVEFPRTAANS